MIDAPSGPLHHASVLVVEDEIAIAVLLEDELREAGYAIIGPASTVEEASGLVSSQRIDAAILDIALTGRSVDTILAPLIARGVPLVFMTGYGEGELPDWVPPVRRFAKPFHMPDLVACLPDLIQRSREGAG